MPWMSAAEWWLATASRPTAVTTAATCRACPRRGLTAAESIAALVAYTPRRTWTRLPERTSAFSRFSVIPASRHPATAATLLLRTASGMSRCVTSHSDMCSARDATISPPPAPAGAGGGELSMQKLLLDVEQALVDELVDAERAELAAEAGSLGAAEGQVGALAGRGVHVGHAHLELL